MNSISSKTAETVEVPKVVQTSDSSQISEIGVQKPNPRASSPPSDSMEISNVKIQKHSPPETLPPSEPKKISTIGTQKRGPAASLSAKVNVPSVNRSIIMPSIVPRDSTGKDSIGSRRESIALAKASSGMNSRSSHARRQSSSRLDTERMSVALESLPSDNVRKPAVSRKDLNIRNRLFPDANSKDFSEEKQSNIDTVVEKPDRTSLPATTSSM